MSDKEIILLDEDRLEYLIEQQHQRYHHIQSMARGVLGTVVALAALFATLIASFYELFPSFVSDVDEYTEIALQLGIQPVAAQLISVLNFLLVYTYLFMSIITASIVISKLSEVVLGRPLSPGKPQNNTFVLKTHDWMENGEYVQFLHKSLGENQQEIQNAYSRLLAGALRILLLISYIIVSVILYVNISDQNLESVLIYNGLILILGFIPTAIYKRLGDRSDVEHLGDGSTLIQEIFYENHPQSRWSEITTRPSEKRLYLLSALISLLSLIIFSTSYLLS